MGENFANLQEKIRAPVESKYNALRQEIEEQYVKDKNDLETTYREALSENRQEKEEALQEKIRAPVESKYNALRQEIEEQYVKDKNDLEATYREALSENRQEKEEALVAAGLGSDGSSPPIFDRTISEVRV